MERADRGRVAHLERCGVAVEAGPMERFGAKGAGTSVYFRDPDGSLMEFISYARQSEQRRRGTQPASTIRTCCRADIPVPQDDGAARHLPGGLARSALPATRGGSRQSVEAQAAAPWSTSIRVPACRASITAAAGTIFPARAAARRNPARSATISPSSSARRSACFRPLDPGHGLSARGR